MSGQFPVHHRQTAGSAPIMDNISGWNHSPSGVGILSGPSHPAQSPGRGPGHSHIQSGTSPKTSKFPVVSHNGAEGGMIVDSVGAISNPLLNLHMYVNQDSDQIVQCSNYNITMPGGLKEVPHQNRTLGCGQNNPLSLGSSLHGKESHCDIQNGDLASDAVSTTPCNGEATSKNVAACTKITLNQLPLENPRVGISSSLNHDNDLPNNIVQVPAVNNKTNFSVDIKVPSSSSTQQLPMGYDAECLTKSIDKMSSDCKPCDNVANDITNKVNRLSKSNDGQLSGCEAAPLLGTVKQDVHDVESQMAALFAGIADDGKSGLESKVLTDVSNGSHGTPNIAAVLESKNLSLRRGKGKTANGLPKAADSIFGTSTESTPKRKRKLKPVKDRSRGEGKKKKLKQSGPGKGKYVKEVSCDNGSTSSLSRARGPVIHIEGPKEAPTLISVVNAPSRLDDDENEIRRKGHLNRVRKSHSNEGKYSSAGLCDSSLVSRHEAHSNDPRWVCVFCKKGCHVNGLGDLFGPYVVKQDHETDHNFVFEVNVDRKTIDKKSKRSGLGQTGVQGLLPIPPSGNEPSQYMVWIHEDCAVWASGVHLIGSRLVGLQEAVWLAINTKCTTCNGDGAVLGCRHHGCGRRAHYPCALEDHWNLDEALFISTCHLHSENIVKL